ncbi:unnamed protein product [Cyprideis torosa]|uniref:Uncharacterized protein n=1 Tax=Cyprideis torosa TaxID=163714 RepID=A0A7R8W7J0_9CRUS|nr:unnamed protein product [Cyprideis torosa]CAG0887618.1 unnamed protein product [Cyprideis torosa]
MASLSGKGVKPKVFKFDPAANSGGDISDDETERLLEEVKKPSTAIDNWLNPGSKSTKLPNSVSSRELQNFPVEAVGTDPIPLEPIDTANIDCDQPLLILFGEIMKPTQFYFQVVDKYKTLEKVMKEMDKYYGVKGKGHEWLIPQKHLVPGLHVAAPYHSHEDFHRAKILKLNEINTIAEVFYIDYGSKIYINTMKLRYLHVDFLKELPHAQAQPGTLKDVVPTPEFNYRLLDKFYNFVFNKVLTCIEAHPNGKGQYELEIFDTSDKDDVHLATHCVDVLNVCQWAHPDPVAIEAEVENDAGKSSTDSKSDDEEDGVVFTRAKVIRDQKEVVKALQEFGLDPTNDRPVGVITNDQPEGLQTPAELAGNISGKNTLIREAQTLAFLARFQAKLDEVKEKGVESDDGEDLDDDKEGNDDQEDESWMRHRMKTSEAELVLAKDANRKAADWYEVTDPRNPITKRRREESKRIMADRKRPRK